MWIEGTTIIFDLINETSIESSDSRLYTVDRAFWIVRFRACLNANAANTDVGGHHQDEQKIIFGWRHILAIFRVYRY